MPIYEYKCPKCGYTEDMIMRKPKRQIRIPHKDGDKECHSKMNYKISASNFVWKEGKPT